MNWTVKVYDSSGMEVESRLIHWQQSWTFEEHSQVEMTVVAYPPRFWPQEGEEDDRRH